MCKKLCYDFCTHFEIISSLLKPLPVAARSKAWVCGLSLAGMVVSNPAGGMDDSRVCLCCQVEVSVLDLLLVQRSPTGCGECTSVIVKPR
jgi:hypothetical protein